MNNSKVIYIDYSMNQLQLPSDLLDCIPENHISRIVNEVVENIDMKILEKAYTGGGSSYHPKMMLKIVLYAYTQKVTSGRRIARMCKEHIPMIWLSGRCTPDFRTINRFRSEKMKDIITDVFETLVIYIVIKELADTDVYYIDGTKIEADTNKFTFVWSKSTDNFQNKITDNIKKFLKDAEKLAYEENNEGELLEKYSDLAEISSNILKSLEEKDSRYKKAVITSEQIDTIGDKLDKIEEKLTEKNVSKKHKINPIRKMRKKFTEDFSPRMKKYERYKTILSNRNSFSKTDTDATFMFIHKSYPF
ncbi:MAG: transposase [Peptostreptococcus porci]|uniref:Transposase n=1 Tax=Peptostreptococcus porci TaxID=2652282 RepID=A0A6N7XFB2_9FIRM|nr:transposase [Peptostreptococcus porci]MDY5480381.1 transposase [Peptostreptococcus porci]MST63062.1 transposase [Peptostreptococcus porci]